MYSNRHKVRSKVSSDRYCLLLHACHALGLGGYQMYAPCTCRGGVDHEPCDKSPYCRDINAYHHHPNLQVVIEENLRVEIYQWINIVVDKSQL